MPPVSINVTAIIVAALINMAIGAIWYSPILFANAWMSTVGKKKEEIASPSPIYLVVLLGALLEAYVLTHFVSYAIALNALDGARIGLWLAVGIVIPIISAISLFESKGLKWLLITVGYHSLALMAMGAILASLSNH